MVTVVRNDHTLYYAGRTQCSSKSAGRRRKIVVACAIFPNGDAWVAGSVMMGSSALRVTARTRCVERRVRAERT